MLLVRGDRPQTLLPVPSGTDQSSVCSQFRERSVDRTMRKLCALNDVGSGDGLVLGQEPFVNQIEGCPWAPPRRRLCDRQARLFIFVLQEHPKRLFSRVARRTAGDEVVIVVGSAVHDSDDVIDVQDHVRSMLATVPTRKTIARKDRPAPPIPIARGHSLHGNTPKRVLGIVAHWESESAMFPDTPRMFPGLTWERHTPTTLPGKEYRRYCRGNVWERREITTIPGCSQMDDQPRHGSTAEPCRAWEGSSWRAGGWE